MKFTTEVGNMPCGKRAVPPGMWEADWSAPSSVFFSAVGGFFFFWFKMKLRIHSSLINNIFHRTGELLCLDCVTEEMTAEASIIIMKMALPKLRGYRKQHKTLQ